MYDYEKLTDFLDGYVRHFEELLGFEDQKTINIMNDNIDALTKSLSREQALIMKTNSLEKKRIELTGDKPLREVIAEAPDQYKNNLKEKQFRLTEVITQIRKLNEYSMNIAKKRLDIFNSSDDAVETYDQKGHKSHQVNDSVTLDKGV